MTIEIDNYKESDVAGSKHARCKEIRIFNPYQSQPRVDFVEETAYILGNDEYILRDAGSMSLVIDMEGEIEDEAGNKTTYGEMYKWMAIAYLKEARKRDLLKEQAQAEDELRVRVQYLYDQYVVEYWDNPLYEQVDYETFKSVMSDNPDAEYEEIVGHFSKDSEGEQS